MNAIPGSLAVQGIQLDHILQSAVALNWKDLAQGEPAGVIQIEYHVSGERSVDCLKIWSRTSRGYSSLICNYSVATGWSAGPRFSNGFHSRDLGRLLESIMMNQNLFQLRSEPDSNVVVQVGPPTSQQMEAARLELDGTFPAPLPALKKVTLKRLPVLPLPATV